MGATTAEVKALTDSNLDFNAWLDAQFAMKPGVSAWQVAIDLGVDKWDGNGDKIPDLIGSNDGLDNVLWYRLFKSPDVLRQRIVLALSEIFVVSVRNMPIPWGQRPLA